MRIKYLYLLFLSTSLILYTAYDRYSFEVNEVVNDLFYGSLTETKNKIDFYNYFTSNLSKLKRKEDDYYRINSSEDINNNYFDSSEIREHIKSKTKKDTGYKESLAKLTNAESRTSKGLAIEDFDNDGFLDLIVSSNFGETKYYKNVEGKLLEEQTTERGLSQAIQGYSITSADYDNDGWLDLFIARPFHHFQLYKNLSGKKFVDVTFETGLIKKNEQDKAYLSWQSAWADIDNDGDLDLFVAQAGTPLNLQGELFSKQITSSKLYINEGKRFTEQSSDFGLEELLKNRDFVGATFGDYNDDGYQDLFLSSFTRNQSFLLKNEKGKRFKKTHLIKTASPSFMASFLDFNNDGKLDLFLSSNTQAKSLYSAIENRDPHKYANKIFLQQADGSFISKKIKGTSFSIPALGSSFGDLNNDSCLDFYFASGNPEPWYKTPNLLYLQKKKKGICLNEFEDFALGEEVGFQVGQSASFFDFNNDGLLELYAANGGFWPSEAKKNQFFFQTKKNTNNWISLRLKGRSSNRFGIGAKIKIISLDTKGQTKTQYRVINNKTGFASAPYLAHIGLGTDTSIDKIEVRWPGTNQVKTYNTKINRLNILDEDGRVTN